MSKLVCPVCWEPVTGMKPEDGRLSMRRGIRQDGRFAMRPCGHLMRWLMSAVACGASGCTRTVTVGP